MTAKKEKIFQNKILFVLMIFCIFYKFLTFRMFDIGGDAINYWFAAKHILYNVSYINLDHQTSRFGLILPIWLSQLLFGSHPAVSLIIPNILFFIHIILIYKIGVLIKDVSVGFVSAILFMLCPYVIRFGTQVAPEAIGIPLITASFYFLLLYHDDTKREKTFLAISAFLLFWAYCTHEINIFFMPGFLIVIMLFKKNLKHVMFYSAILFCLFLCETAIFYYYTNDILARFHAITGHHFTQEKLIPISFWNLFERYTSSQLWWRIPFYIYLLALYPVWKKSTKLIRAAIIPGTLYFIFMLFAVKSVNPIIPALPYKEIYLMPALPFMVLIITIFVYDLYELLKKKYLTEKHYPSISFKSIKNYVVFVFALCGLALIIIMSGILPDKAKPYYNNPLEIKEHKALRFFTYYKLLNEAYNSNIPIVSDYIYTIADRELYNKVQKLISEGNNLAEAIAKVGIDMKTYIKIRPNMPVKSLNAVRKVFLNVNPLEIPEIKTAIESDRIYYYIINKNAIHLDEKKLFSKGLKLIYATSGELKVKEDVL